MSTQTQGSDAASLRTTILSDPAVILEDPQILQALVDAEQSSRGGNVVDMRSLAMDKLQSRLGTLEDTHQQVISAAYDNVATTAQVHRALLTMITPLDFDGFLDALAGPVPDCLRLDAIRLVLESEGEAQDCQLNQLNGVISLLPAGYVAGYASQGRRHVPPPVILRSVTQGSVSVYGTAAASIRSEAVVPLDLGPGRAPGLLVMGADTPEHFAPGQATELLELFARVCERLLRSWLK